MALRRHSRPLTTALIALLILGAAPLAAQATPLSETTAATPTFPLTLPDTGWSERVTQTVTVSTAAVTAPITRDSYTVTAPPPPPPVVVHAAALPVAVAFAPAAAAAAAVSPGSAKGIASRQVRARGWASAQYNCLVSLWNKESNWNHRATNRSSGAYGIPQAFPGSKMASAGKDWRTNPATQIKWGLGYIQSRYGNPCGAWNHSQSVGWY